MTIDQIAALLGIDTTGRSLQDLKRLVAIERRKKRDRHLAPVLSAGSFEDFFRNPRNQISTSNVFPTEPFRSKACGNFVRTPKKRRKDRSRLRGKLPLPHYSPVKKKPPSCS